MDLLNRYLQAIGKYLPEETRVDTLAELRANLLEQMDARAEELDRPLTDAEVADVLKAHGKPESVALRYLPQRSLIGPRVFPFFELTLRRVLPLVVYVSALAGGIQFVSSRHETLPHALVSFALGVVYSLLVTMAIIAGVFAVIEWALDHGKLNKQWNEWDPSKLPALRDDAADEPTLKATWKRVLDLALHCIWTAYLLWVPWHLFWLLGPGVFYLDRLNVAFAPVWHTFYMLLIVQLSVQLVVKILMLSPAFQRHEKPLELATRTFVIAAFGWLALQQVIFVPSGPDADLQQLAQVNQGVVLAFRVAVVFIAVGLLADVWKYAKGGKMLRQFAF